MHELPLVFFTVLAQASAGLLILSVVNRLVFAKQYDEERNKTMLLVCFGIVALAGICAIFHLGRPLRAINALFGLGRSPMSNEIFSCAVYGGLVLVCVLLSYLRPGLKGVQLAVQVLAAIAGVVLLLLIPAVYSFPTVTQWSTSFTQAQMILAAFTLGGALCLVWLPNRFNVIVTVVATLLSFFIVPSYMAFLADTAPAMLTNGMQFWDAKLVLYGLALVFALFGYQKSYRTVTLGCCGLFLLAELAGRVAFYDLWSITM